MIVDLKELELINELLIDAIDNLSKWSVENDDYLNGEVTDLNEITHDIQAKYKDFF